MVTICATECRPAQGNKRTFAGRIPGLVPVDGGDRKLGNVGKVFRAENVGGEGIGHDLVVPRMVQISGGLNGVVEASEVCSSVQREHWVTLQGMVLNESWRTNVNEEERSLFGIRPDDPASRVEGQR